MIKNIMKNSRENYLFIVEKKKDLFIAFEIKKKKRCCFEVQLSIHSFIR